jgi:hypothetical protein
VQAADGSVHAVNVDDMQVTLTDDDEGKTVVDATGRTLGLVTRVVEDTAYVDPQPGLGEKLKAAVGWGDADAEEYTVHQEAIESRGGDELRLRGEL